MVIGFDVDGCLIDEKDNARADIIELLKALSEGNTIVVWSGGGAGYAKMWIDRLGLDKFVDTHGHKLEPYPFKVDIAIDDQEVELGKFNIKV